MPSRGPLVVLRRVLANRDLGRVFAAFLAFNAAELATWVAILLYAYERIGPASVGVVALVQLVPAALVAPWAASLGDRYPRNRVLTLGYLVQAVAMLATAAAMLADAPVPVVILLATVTASSLVVSRPTQSALLPSLARTPEELTAANGVAGAVEGVGLLIGPLLAAAILAVSTPAAVFAAGGATMIFASLVTIGLRPRGGLATLSGSVASEPTTLEATARRDDGGILAGLRAIGGDPDALLVVGLLTARMVMIGASDVLFVLMALELLDTGESGAGILAAALGAGSILGGAATFLLVGRQRLALVATIGACLWGGALLLVGVSAHAAIAPLLIVLGATGLSVVDIAGRTILQRAIRDDVLARVFGLQEGLAMAGLAAGAILVPVLVAVGGLVGAIVFVAAFLPIGVLIAWRRLAALDRRAADFGRELELLRRTVIFGPLPAPQLVSVARRAVWSTVPAGTVVIAEGDPGDRYYVIASGAVRVERAGRHLRDMGRRGEGFGEIALLHDVPRTATVVATEPTELLAIDRAAFLGAVTGHPDAYGAAEHEVRARAD
jgi:hypothetical protein